MIGLGKSINDLTEADLQLLVDSAVPESVTLEYKQALIIGTPGEKCEFLKDVSALANRIGGDLIYGIREMPGADRWYPTFRAGCAVTALRSVR